ncbi:TonB-dependent siderophore receptor [Nitrobacter winogradskyi]|uniref:Iron complex outermembrane receptor protein n=2 Tax=Nitrobacter winogradskyi TaxID=913 RepID=A0ACC6ALY6_NITWI|nr:TonB-dependent siderophore receptor [Nitrobacter winogradskyi]MCP2000878.1 iron complex outermembrane receptor protein [Nitrobacter winogradskyi]
MARLLTSISFAALLLPSQAAFAQTAPSSAPSAGALQQSITFAIPPQSLSSGIVAFSRAAGIDLVFDGAVPRGARTSGVSGTFTVRDGVNRLLAGTGLTARFTNARTVQIVSPSAAGGASGAAPSGAISLDTIDVQGETAWGPVQGYVASRSATATKTDTPIIEVPQSISVVTRDQMEARQVQSLNETLRYTAGVLAESTGQQGSAPTFRIRGFSAIPFNGSMYLNGLRTISNGDVEPYGLERVEVMRGPASVLYGQNNPGGVVGMVTKRPTEGPVHEVQLRGGSFGYKAGAFDFSGPATEDRRLLYRFTGLLREGGNGIDFSNDQRAFVSGAVTWRPTDATELTAFSLYQKDKVRWNYGLPAHGTVLPNPNGRIPITRFIGEPSIDYNMTERAVVGYNLEHRAHDNVVFRQNLQYAREIWDYRNVQPDGLQADLRTLNRSATADRSIWDTFAVDNQGEVKATTGIFHHTVLFGVDYRWRHFNNTGAWGGTAGPIDVYAPVYGQPVFIPADNYGSRQTEVFPGIYLQDQIKFDHWILTLGGRHDWASSKTVNVFSNAITDQNDRALTKRGGLGYEFDNGVVPYISYSESFLPVSGTTFDRTPFRPETGTQYEAGVKYQPHDMNLRITAAIYDLRRQNVLTQDPANPFYSIQIGEVTSRGFEFEAVTSLTSGLSLTGAYAYNDSKVTESNDGDLGKRPVRAPQHLASVWADYAIRDGALNGLTLGGGVRYVGASAGNAMNTFYAPAYTVVDAMIRYDIDKWRFSVNATNLFDTQYVAGCAIISQCNVGRVRTVIGQVSYRW